MNKPTIPEVLPLIKKYYSNPCNSSGGNLHIFFEDWNIKDKDLTFCLAQCHKDQDGLGAELCALLLQMSKRQRRKIVKISMYKYGL